MVETVDDVRTKVKAVRRERLKRSLDGTGSQALGTIISHIVSIVEQKARAHAGAHK